MKFTRAQILQCINDPAFVSGRNPLLPVAYPLGREVSAAAVAGPKFGYIAIRPAPNVMVDIRAVFQNSYALRWHLLTQDQFVEASLGQVPENEYPLWRLQDPAINAAGRSTIAFGVYGAVPGAVSRNSLMFTELDGTNPNVGVTGVTQQKMIAFPDPVVLFDDPKPNLFVLVCLNGNLRVRASILVREWPIDTDNY